MDLSGSEEMDLVWSRHSWQADSCRVVAEDMSKDTFNHWFNSDPAKSTGRYNR